MLGELAIYTVIFVVGFYSGKKFDSLNDLRKAVVAKVRDWK